MSLDKPVENRAPEESPGLPLTLQFLQVTPLEKRWLVAAQQLTDSLIAAPLTVDPFVIAADYARRAAGAAHVVTIVGVTAEELASADHNADASPIRLVHDDLLSRLRSVTPSVVPQLSPEALFATGLPAAPALIANLCAADCDFGVIAFVREPGDPEFQVEELSLAQGFASRAAAMIAHLRALGAREARAVQNDRVRIAANFHDLVIQSLFGVGLRLQSLTSRVGSEEVAGDLENCIGQIDETILAVRRSIFALRQPVTEEIGLRSQILNTVTATPFGFDPTVHFNGPIDSAIPESIHEHLLISLGEILTNVIRHAGADAVDVAVTVDLQARVAELRVADDGIGWQGQPRAGHGTGNFLERANALGGSCEFSAAHGGGTEVRWWVSLNEPDECAPGAWP